MSDIGEIQAEADPLLQFLASLPELRGLSTAGIQALNDCAIQHRFNEGEGFHRPLPGEWLFLVCSGCVTLHCGAETRRPISLRGGAIIEQSWFSLHSLSSGSIVATEPSFVCAISIPDLEAALKSDGEIRDKVRAAGSLPFLQLEISSVPLFAGTDASLASIIAQQSRFLSIKRGAILIHEGDPSDGVYLIVAGALEVYRELSNNQRQSIEILREGACVGELAALLNQPRTTNVRAWRDTLLIKIPDTCMQEVLASNAQVTLRLARDIGERLKQTTAARPHSAAIKVVVIIPLCPLERSVELTKTLRHAIGAMTGKRSALLGDGDFRRDGGSATDLDQFPAWLADQELKNDYVLFQCDGDDSDATLQAVQQADLVLFIAMQGQAVPQASSLRSLEAARALTVRMELILLREVTTEPIGTEAWFALPELTTYHQVRLGQIEDIERVARRVSGREIGLILGGGGARGFAHLGVLRAIEEAGIPIDVIGGTSMGAVLAAMYAAGLSVDEMIAATRKAYVQNSGGSDFTLPFVSICSGGGTIRKLRRIFGERRIEDLPRRYFCVSCDLTRAEVVVHDRGPVWLWARVSCSVPGLLPPVPYEGQLLADGGLLDNLPVSIMRTRCNGFVIASDVSVAQDLLIDRTLDMKTSWSGFSHLLRKLTNRPRLPHIAHLLMRSAEISSVRDSRLEGSPANWYLHPPVDQISMSDFQAIDRIVDIGHQYSARKLQDCKSSFVLP